MHAAAALGGLGVFDADTYDSDLDDPPAPLPPFFKRNVKPPNAPLMPNAPARRKWHQARPRLGSIPLPHVEAVPIMTAPETPLHSSRDVPLFTKAVTQGRTAPRSIAMPSTAEALSISPPLSPPVTASSHSVSTPSPQSSAATSESGSKEGLRCMEAPSSTTFNWDKASPSFEASSVATSLAKIRDLLACKQPEKPAAFTIAALGATTLRPTTLHESSSGTTSPKSFGAWSPKSCDAMIPTRFRRHTDIIKIGSSAECCDASFLASDNGGLSSSWSPSEFTKLLNSTADDSH